MIFAYFQKLKLTKFSKYYFQFEIEGYKDFCKDSNNRGGGTIFYINENIPCRKLNSNILQKEVEPISVEFSLINRKWNLPIKNEGVFLDDLGKELKNLAFCYDNFILLRDFNLTVENKNFNSFMNFFNLENLIKTPTPHRHSYKWEGIL